ncbi:methyl-accepting chemotaxis protein, partial [Paraburkholderia sp. Se-20369]|nr:methyl-accepting chemotaxis protein [Paraburkholderia sp. Se-20369]
MHRLSTRSAVATRSTLSAHVRHLGLGLVVEAGEVMRDVVAQVQGVTTLMSEIAEASQEQSAGIDQIGG